MNPPSASAEAAFQAEVRATLRRNYVAHLAHGMLGQTGMRLLNAPTLVPAYVFALAGTEWAVGVARALQYLGMFLSPIVGATLIEHRRRVLPVGFLIGVSMRVMILGLALGGLFLPQPGPLYSAWVFLGLFGVFLGIQGVVFNFLYAKVIPVEVRGRLMGLRNALGGTTAFLVSLAAGEVLIERNALGNGYAATFLLAFVFTSVGLATLLFVREPASPAVRERAGVFERLRELPSLLRSDREFTVYFLARALAVMGRMGMPLYVLYASGTQEIGGSQLGQLTAAFVLTQSVGNFGWGVVADRRGYRATFLAALALWILSVVALLHTASFGILLLVFGGIGLGLGGFQMSAQNLVLEFGSREQLPLRIAVANSASELVAALGALAGGLLAVAVGQAPVLWIATGFQLVAFAIVALRVTDPRRR
ncbi:MAG: MFS transporter [Myxococcota bacterium]